MKVTASLNNLRITPRKSKIVADLIKGLDVKDALSQLDIHVKKTSPYLKKLLLSAIANGENNLGLDKDNLYVSDVRVGARPTIKRWMPKAFGRAGKIIKRTAKIEIFLEERVEGKGRKTKEDLEKEKKERLEEKRKAEKTRTKEEEKTEKEKKESVAERMNEVKKEDGEIKKDGKAKSWTKKIFRRKSM
jgi:large subunit ribosomal protein L22